MTYDYKCVQCNLTLSVERSIHSEASNPICSDCNEVMQRVWNTPSVTFKGSGFYSTDN